MMGIEMILTDILPIIIGVVAIWIVFKIITGVFRIILTLAILAAVAYVFMGSL